MSKIVYFQKKKYDIHKYLDFHPGGSHIFENMDNLDITPLVYSYHPKVNKVINVLQKYEISPTGSPTFSSDNNQVIRQTEYNYQLYEQLKEKCLKKLPEYKWTSSHCLYNCLWGILYFLNYVFFLMNPNILNSFTLGVIGICFAGLVQHESSHNSVSKNPLINNILRYMLYPFGSITMWDYDHNLLHHPFTNTEFDEDFSGVDDYKVARFSKSKKHYFWYFFQSLYLPLVFSIVVFGKGIGKSLLICFNLDKNKYSMKSRIECFFHTLVFSLLFSYMYSHFSLIYPLITYITFSYIFMIFSQVNHINSLNTEVSKERQLDFCINQIESSTNYKTNFLTKFLSFGLYAQIEHHLFPFISHEHYSKIMDTVKEFCKENNIQYNEEPSFSSAFYKYVKHLYDCSFQ